MYRVVNNNISIIRGDSATITLSLTDAGGGEIVWTTADNQRVSMSIADFAAINGAAAVRSNSLHIKYNELKQRVNAAQTVEEVEAIHWPED